MKMKYKMKNKVIITLIIIPVMLLMSSMLVSAYKLDKVQVLCNEDGTFSAKNVYKENVYPRSSEGVCFEVSASEWKEFESHPDFSERARVNKKDKKLFINTSLVTKKTGKGKLSSTDYTVGYAEIAAGDVVTRVLFEEEFGKVPIVTATPVGLHDFNYGVSDLRVSGFDIEISQAQSEDVIFNWHATGKAVDSNKEQVPDLVIPIEPPVEGPDEIVIPVEPPIEEIPEEPLPDEPVNETVPANETVPDLIIPIEPPAENSTENIEIPIEPPVEDPIDKIIGITGMSIGERLEVEKISMKKFLDNILDFFKERSNGEWQK